LNNFRCFAQTAPLEVLPITFLIGENSAGKTTFLAAVRLLLESFTRSPLNPFNKEPYFLGGFDQIAHYRGGVRGRARSFSLQITVPASEGASLPHPQRSRRQATTTNHKFTFVKGSSPQPELTQYEFSIPSVSIVLNLTEKVTLKILKDGNEIFQFTPKRLPPAALLRKDLSYLRFVFDEISFGKDRPVANIGRLPGIDSPSEATATAELSDLVDNLLARFAESTRFIIRRIFASAPVRTQPLRTYTPSEISASSEGAHVPLEMARQKISSSTEWATVHEKLAQFGTNSGLFDDIDIRLLGKRDGDPFQILVKTKGPPFNLMDVGYGVSQVLPIIYQLEQPPRPHDVFLLQQPEVHLHPRAQAELGTLVSRLSRQRPGALFMLETHSDYIIDRVRIQIAEGTLDPKSVTIIFFDRLEHEVHPINIYFSDKGEILNPPYNFRSFFLEEHARLLGL
jgi:hypothetical protein